MSFGVTSQTATWLLYPGVISRQATTESLSHRHNALVKSRGILFQVFLTPIFLSLLRRPLPSLAASATAIEKGRPEVGGSNCRCCTIEGDIIEPGPDKGFVMWRTAKASHRNTGSGEKRRSIWYRWMVEGRAWPECVAK